ncbi:tail fiber domain-containing protein [Stieleria varia]|uniref:Peptidase S74 domain-containing protein n=1 Tax=Stieleria varia TaxID=2528005 RepID=A0A5C6A323_9BACT|nr:tail fiber domain-containing protein [Stieleria varia]TWT93770.1 hypothetical protein Pla52n_55980 [Stieleria varia]
MKTAVLSLLLLFSIFAVKADGQSLTGERVLLDSSFPYIRFTRTSDQSHYIDCLTDQLSFLLNGSYRFRVFETAKPDALVVDSQGITVAGSGTGTQIIIDQVPTSQQFGVTSLSSQQGLHNGGIGFRVDSASYPFYVFDTANNESLSVREEGVGIGTYDATAPLHVYSDGNPFSEASVRVENNLGGSPVQREMFSLVNNGGSKFTFTDTSNGNRWLFATQNNGSFVCSRSGTNGNEFVITADGRVTMGPGPAINFNLAPNGNLQIAGTLTQSSDKNLKTAFMSVDPLTILDRVASMPVQSWQFKFDEPELRHLGPTAQDFHAAFGLGQDDKTIAPVDGIGVSLAAIQALKIECVEKDNRIDELEVELSSYKRDMDQQKEQLTKQGILLSEQDERLSNQNAQLSQQRESIAEQRKTLVELMSRLDNIENVRRHERNDSSRVAPSQKESATSDDAVSF